MDKETKHRYYWIGRAQELQSNPHQLADEILEFAESKCCDWLDSKVQLNTEVCTTCSKARPKSNY